MSDIERKINEYMFNVLKNESVDYIGMKSRLNYTYMMRLIHAKDGIVTEAGELCDCIKKHIFYGKKLDAINIIEEVGDLLWYIFLLINVIDEGKLVDELYGTQTILKHILDRNIEKLNHRYKKGFTKEEALNRNIESERKILEDKNDNSR